MAGLTREQRAEREAAKLAELHQEELTPEQEQELDKELEKEGANQIAFVMMVRDEEKYPAPHTAQVHPDEVQNYYSGGWVEDKS